MAKKKKEKTKKNTYSSLTKDIRFVNLTQEDMLGLNSKGKKVFKDTPYMFNIVFVPHKLMKKVDHSIYDCLQETLFNSQIFPNGNIHYFMWLLN